MSASFCLIYPVSVKVSLRKKDILSLMVAHWVDFVAVHAEFDSLLQSIYSQKCDKCEF